MWPHRRVAVSRIVLLVSKQTSNYVSFLPQIFHNCFMQKDLGLATVKFLSTSSNCASVDAVSRFSIDTAS